MSLATVYALYNGNSGNYVGDQNIQLNVNCNLMRDYSPRQCWLKRRLMPGDGTQIQSLITFDGTDPEIDSNTLQGYWIEVDGQDTMIDIVDWQHLITACNCPDCVSGTGNPVARFYVYGAPTFSAPVGNFYCVTRADDGSGYAHDVVVTDYAMQYIGNVRVKSNVSGVSVYTFQSYYSLAQLTAMGTDTIVQC